MIIYNPRSEKNPYLKSFITTEYKDYSYPRMIQIHGNKVVIINSPDQIVWEADGMVTNLKNIELHTRVADCGNIYTYDSINHVIGICHSGRQGTHKNIIHNLIQSMKILWSQSKNIMVRTWPCISSTNYQFWPEVISLFEADYYKLKWDSYYLNLPKIHFDQLLSEWILLENIIQSDMCTFDNIELPSYRRQWSDSGRITWSIMQIN